MIREHAGLVPVVTFEHEGWGRIGVFIHRAERAVQIMAVDAKGAPRGLGLRLRGSEVVTFLAAVEMAFRRLEGRS